MSTNAKRNEGELFYLEFDDRRRLVVSETLMRAEKSNGAVFPIDFGNAVLHNILDPVEVVPLCDAANMRLLQIASRGY